MWPLLVGAVHWAPLHHVGFKKDVIVNTSWYNAYQLIIIFMGFSYFECCYTHMTKDHENKKNQDFFGHGWGPKTLTKKNPHHFVKVSVTEYSVKRT